MPMTAEVQLNEYPRKNRKQDSPLFIVGKDPNTINDMIRHQKVIDRSLSLIDKNRKALRCFEETLTDILLSITNISLIRNNP